MNEAEQAEILEFARQTIRNQMPAGELRFFPVSARQGVAAQQSQDAMALEASRIPQLVSTIDQYLASHKGHVLIRSTCTALQRLVRDEALAVEIEQRALAVDAEELNVKTQTIEKAWQTLDQRHREAAYVLRGEIQAFQAELEKRLNDFAQEEARGLVSHLKTKVRELSKQSKREIAREAAEELRRKVAGILEEWKMEEEEAVEEKFEALTRRFSREAAAILGEVQKAAAEQFGFSWNVTPLPDQLTAESRFRIKVDEIVTWGLTKLPLLLPKRFFVSYLAHQMEQTCPEELYRNAGRLKVDLAERLDESVTTYLRALDRQMEAARESVRAALKRAAAVRQRSETERRGSLEKKSSRLQILTTLGEELLKIRDELQKGAV